jgi:dihydroorotase
MTDNESLLLINGRIVDPANKRTGQGDLFVKAGRIAVPPRGGKTVPDHVRVIDCTGKLVLPGLVDMHVHLREPGEEYKETIQSGTRAAAAGGFTGVACMPNTRPVNDCEAVTKFILKKAQDAAARVYPVGAISKASGGETLAEFGELKEAGAVAVSDDGRPVVNSQLMRRALEYASNFELPVISHAEDLSLTQGGAMNEGAMATALGLKPIPASGEEVMIYRDISLAELTGQPLHIAHVSTRESVSLIRRAKEKGIRVTAETAPHYFTLTEKAVAGYNTNAKMNPPLRSDADVEAIRAGLADGTIDVIASDHAPHSILEKELEFDLAANGIIGLETTVPLTLALVRAGIITIEKMVELLAVHPTRILGIAGGSLARGAVADITVIDPDKVFVYTKKRVVSKSANSPFLNRRLQGKAVLTIVGGRITYQDL